MRADFIGRFGGLSVNQDICVLNQTLQAGATPSLNTGRQKGVQPLACFFGRDLQSEVRILVDDRVHARKRTGRTLTVCKV
jgi:hypothetical protein